MKIEQKGNALVLGEGADATISTSKFVAYTTGATGDKKLIIESVDGDTAIRVEIEQVSDVRIGDTGGYVSFEDVVIELSKLPSFIKASATGGGVSPEGELNLDTIRGATTLNLDGLTTLDYSLLGSVKKLKSDTITTISAQLNIITPNVEEIDLPSLVRIFETNAINNLNKLRRVNLPKLVVVSHQGLLTNCNQMTELDISGVRYINAQYFVYLNRSLTTLTLGDIITNGASGSNFRDNWSLTHIYVPDEWTIKADVYFLNCSQITRDSCMRMFNALVSNVGNTPVSIGFSSQVIARLSAADIAVATNKNYNVITV